MEALTSLNGCEEMRAQRPTHLSLAPASPTLSSVSPSPTPSTPADSGLHGSLLARTSAFTLFEMSLNALDFELALRLFGGGLGSHISLECSNKFGSLTNTLKTAN